MVKVKKYLTLSLCFLVYSYRCFFAGLFPKACRFYPSCSVYALDALKIKGPFLGLFYIFKRICRCHPWHPGGYDPIEPKQEN